MALGTLLVLQWSFQAWPKNNSYSVEALRASEVALVVKNLPADAGDTGDVDSTSGLGRSPGRGHGNSLQHFCMENPMDRGAWWVAVHGVAKSRTGLKGLRTQVAGGLTGLSGPLDDTPAALQVFSSSWCLLKPGLCVCVCIYVRERERVRACGGGGQWFAHLSVLSFHFDLWGRHESLMEVVLFFRSLLNLFQHCFCSMFWSLEAHGILARWPRIDPMPPALEGDVPATGPPGKSLWKVF